MRISFVRLREGKEAMGRTRVVSPLVWYLQADGALLVCLVEEALQRVVCGVCLRSLGPLVLGHPPSATLESVEGLVALGSVCGGSTGGCLRERRRGGEGAAGDGRDGGGEG
jgi:hypothetical protein